MSTPRETAGVGWYEVIHPANATTLLAYVHEDGSVYFPETNDGRAEFEFAAARGNVHRLIRADSLAQHRDDIARAIFERRDSDDLTEWEDLGSVDREWFQCAADAVIAYIAEDTP